MGISTPKRSGLVLITSEPFNAEASLQALQAPLTPTDQHYVRAHFPVPQPPGTLTIEGLVDHPLRLSTFRRARVARHHAQRHAGVRGQWSPGFAAIPQGRTLGMGAVSTAAWTGVPLQTLLAQAQPRPAGRFLLFEGADHGPYAGSPAIRFTRMLPRAEVERLGNDIVLAYEMNGEPLSVEHGAPLRLVVPGWYAVASVKWLERIRVLPDAFSGEFQTHSYVYHWQDGTSQPVTTMPVRALVTNPLSGQSLARGKHTIRGWAWSGAGSVTRVEVGIDDEDSWRPAQLAAPVSPHAWQAWTLEWEATEVGRHLIRARASDSAGAVQPDRPAWNSLGYGNNAVQPHPVEVQ